MIALKPCSVLFAVLWAGFMIWSSGDFSVTNIVGFAVAGAIAGWLWYLGMRWFFRRRGLLPKA
jgi:hypothetical protein